MEILTEYVSSVLRYCSTYPYRVAIGIGTVAVTYGAVRVYFGGGVCYSKAVLPGKTAIITGGNTGIGLETAVDLAKRGARVILACRNTERGEKAVAIVKRRSKNENVSFSKLDLASLQSVREFSARIIEEESHIDILINNAGVMAPPYTTTEDGFELQFGVNHLGHFLLTNLLLGRIKEAPVARIINLSSRAHRTGNIDFADLQSKQCYKRREAYSQSKLANILFTKALSHQLEGTNVTAYSVHPGLVHTQLFRHFSQSLVSYLLIFPLSRAS